MTYKMNLSPLIIAFTKRLQAEGKTVNTLKNYKTDLDCYKNYLETFQDNDQIIHTDLNHILEYGKFLQTKYSSDNSRRRRVQTLRLFYDFLLTKGLVTENPVRKIPASPKFVDVPKPIAFGEVINWWKHLQSEVTQKKESQVSKLLAQRNQVLFTLIYFGGVKVSLLTTILIDDVTINDDGVRVLLTPPKRDPYTISLPAFTSSVFETYITNLKREMVESNLRFDQLLFNANPYRILSGGLSPRGIEIIFEELRNRLSGEGTPKRLRESAICRWINLPIEKNIIKEWMGVAPSYSLNRFIAISDNFVYSDEPFGEFLKNY